MNALRSAIARLIAIQEALEDGNPSYAWTLAYDLELDLAGLLVKVEERAA